MAKLSDRERESIKLQIAEENVMLTRVKRYVQYGGVIFLAAIAMLFTFFKNDTGAAKIITIIIAVIAGLFTLEVMVPAFGAWMALLMVVYMVLAQIMMRFYEKDPPAAS